MPDIEDIWDDEEDRRGYVREEVPRRPSVQEVAPADLTETAKRIAWERHGTAAGIKDVFEQYEGAEGLWAALTNTERDAYLSAARATPPAPVPEGEALSALQTLVGELDSLIDDSEGVSGLHKNGDVAAWSDLMSDGAYPWLSSLDDARRIACARPKAELTPASATAQGQDADDTIKRRWIIIREPGQVPVTKIPPQSHDGAREFLRECAAIYPTAELTLAELTWNNDLWVSDGREALTIDDAMAEYADAADDWTDRVPEPQTSGCEFTMSYADEPNSIVCRNGHMIDIDVFTEGFDEGDFFHPCPKCNADAYAAWKAENGDENDEDDRPSAPASTAPVPVTSAEPVPVRCSSCGHLTDTTPVETKEPSHG